MSSEVRKAGKQEIISIKVIAHLVIYSKILLLSAYYMLGLAEFGTKFVPIHQAQMEELSNEVSFL